MFLKCIPRFDYCGFADPAPAKGPQLNALGCGVFVGRKVVQETQWASRGKSIMEIEKSNANPKCALAELYC